MSLDPILVDVPMPIVTPRLKLRPVQAGDGLDVSAALQESWAEHSRWGIWAFGRQEDSTVEKDEAFCRRRQASFILREKLILLAFDRQDLLVGSGSLGNCDWTARSFSLGFWVRASKARQGYATEIARALVDYAFATLSASRINAMHAEGNAGSQRVLEKTGFAREGVLRKQHSLPDGSIVDEYVYGMLRDDKVAGRG